MHNSIAYFVQILDAGEQQGFKKELEQELARWPLALDLGSAEFCVSNDMFHFDRQFYTE